MFDVPLPTTAKEFEALCAKAMAELKTEHIPGFMGLINRLPVTLQIFLVSSLLQRAGTHQTLLESGCAEFLDWVRSIDPVLTAPFSKWPKTPSEAWDRRNDDKTYTA
jgi:hypothetical protein